MRRLVAALCTPLLANVVVLRTGTTCEAVPHLSSAHTLSATGGHDHHQPLAASHDHDGRLVPWPDDEQAPHPACPMTGPCALTFDLPPAEFATTSHAAGERVLMRTYLAPPSRGATPELPPPRD